MNQVLRQCLQFALFSKDKASLDSVWHFVHFIHERRCSLSRSTRPRQRNSTHMLGIHQRSHYQHDGLNRWLWWNVSFCFLLFHHFIYMLGLCGQHVDSVHTFDPVRKNCWWYFAALFGSGELLVLSGCVVVKLEAGRNLYPCIYVFIMTSSWYTRKSGYSFTQIRLSPRDARVFKLLRHSLSPVHIVSDREGGGILTLKSCSIVIR